MLKSYSIKTRLEIRKKKNQKEVFVRGFYDIDLYEQFLIKEGDNSPFNGEWISLEGSVEESNLFKTNIANNFVKNIKGDFIPVGWYFGEDYFYRNDFEKYDYSKYEFRFTREIAERKLSFNELTKLNADKVIEYCVERGMKLI